VKIQSSQVVDYQMLQITTRDNNNSIESRSFSAGQSGWVSSAQFKIDQKQSAAAASTLSKAIRICSQK
jgi:hypothetical protein